MAIGRDDGKSPETGRRSSVSHSNGECCNASDDVTLKILRMMQLPGLLLSTISGPLGTITPSQHLPTLSTKSYPDVITAPRIS